MIIILREFSRNMEFMIANEVVPMAEALRKAGYKVDLASESGKSIVAGNAKLIPDLKLADAQNADYAGVLIPCMEAGDFPPAESTPEAGVALIKQAVESGKPIAAQCALEMIYAAGVAYDRPVANKPGVVIDGTLITSYNCPTRVRINGKLCDTNALIAAFVAAIKEAGG